jgi:hypothetical protein
MKPTDVISCRGRATGLFLLLATATWACQADREPASDRRPAAVTGRLRVRDRARAGDPLVPVPCACPPATPASCWCPATAGAPAGLQPLVALPHRRRLCPRPGLEHPVSTLRTQGRCDTPSPAALIIGVQILSGERHLARRYALPAVITSYIGWCIGRREVVHGAGPHRSTPAPPRCTRPWTWRPGLPAGAEGGSTHPAGADPVLRSVHRRARRPGTAPRRCAAGCPPTSPILGGTTTSRTCALEPGVRSVLPSTARYSASRVPNPA